MNLFDKYHLGQSLPDFVAKYANDAQKLRWKAVHEQVGLNYFFDRGFEGFNEAVRQFANETDRVREQNVLVRRQAQTAGRGIERGEEFVHGEHVRAGEFIQQRGFAGVGITDDARQRPAVALTRVALG